MVFNILMDNTHDHEKNHAFVRAQDGFYDLSPAYDGLQTAHGWRKVCSYTANRRKLRLRPDSREE